MAYLVSLVRLCQNGCGRKATEQLVNWVNSPVGVYCTPCAPHALRKQNESEAAQVVESQLPRKSHAR